MRPVLLALAVAGHAAGAPAPAASAADWLVMLRWQAMPSSIAAPSDRSWRASTGDPVPDWPALRLRPGATAQWRQDTWQTDDDSTVAWTPRGPLVVAAERRSPRVRALTLQALPTRRTTTLSLAWSVSWPDDGLGGGTEAQGSLTVVPGRWVTVAEWAPPARVGVAAAGDRSWSTDAASLGGWRLQLRAERP